MKSDVFFADLKAKGKTVLDKLDSIKLHFGEKGNTAFIRPIFLRRVVDLVKQYQGKPFLTDTNTLYRGMRQEAVSHLDTAYQNGFVYSVVDAPIRKQCY